MTDGIRAALDRARSAAGTRDVGVGGGVATIRQYVHDALSDELHLAIADVLLGSGEALFAGMNWRALGYRCVEAVRGERATHVTIEHA